jgi:hypothetical protein
MHDERLIVMVDASHIICITIGYRAFQASGNFLREGSRDSWQLSELESLHTCLYRTLLNKSSMDDLSVLICAHNLKPDGISGWPKRG